jgi:hypothetical protein
MQAPILPRSSGPHPVETEPSRLTWTSAPRRFPPGRQKIVGPIVLEIHDWSRPKRGSPQMFDQPFLEWFTSVNPVWLPVFYIPLSIWAFWYGLHIGIAPGVSAALFAAGMVLWTLLEYLIHRYPEDHRRWATPPVLSLPIAAALYFAFRLVLGPYVNPVGSGVALGYLIYDLTHWIVHRAPLKSKIGRFLRTYHLQHHYSTPERRFGVSTPFWDYVFRTDR